jgi:hypothetical protein
MRSFLWLLILLSASSLAIAEQTVAVSFELPERAPVRVAVSLSEVMQLTGVKHPYKVEFWVRGALAKAELKYDVELVDGRRSVTAIDGVRNDSTGAWVYFVDGVRSRYHINTQTAPRRAWRSSVTPCASSPIRNPSRVFRDPR